MKISNKIRKLRELGRVSQAEVADELQISQTAYNKWETGSAKPSLENIMKLCNYYNISIAELVDDDLKILPHNLSEKEIIISAEVMQNIIQNQQMLIELVKEQNGILIRILECKN
ncbi:helix-turn-helix domain-containing protein [Elizabethkingia meningoseptica]